MYRWSFIAALQSVKLLLRFSSPSTWMDITPRFSETPNWFSSFEKKIPYSETSQWLIHTSEELDGFSGLYFCLSVFHSRCCMLRTFTEEIESLISYKKSFRILLLNLRWIIGPISCLNMQDTKACLWFVLFKIFSFRRRIFAGLVHCIFIQFRKHFVTFQCIWMWQNADALFSALVSGKESIGKVW